MMHPIAHNRHTPQPQPLGASRSSSVSVSLLGIIVLALVLPACKGKSTSCTTAIGSSADVQNAQTIVTGVVQWTSDQNAQQKSTCPVAIKETTSYDGSGNTESGSLAPTVLKVMIATACYNAFSEDLPNKAPQLYLTVDQNALQTTHQEMLKPLTDQGQIDAINNLFASLQSKRYLGFNIASHINPDAAPTTPTTTQLAMLSPLEQAAQNAQQTSILGALHDSSQSPPTHGFAVTQVGPTTMTLTVENNALSYIFFNFIMVKPTSIGSVPDHPAVSLRASAAQSATRNIESLQNFILLQASLTPGTDVGSSNGITTTAREAELATALNTLFHSSTPQSTQGPLLIQRKTIGDEETFESSLFAFDPSQCQKLPVTNIPQQGAGPSCIPASTTPQFATMADLSADSFAVSQFSEFRINDQGQLATQPDTASSSQQGSNTQQQTYVPPQKQGFLGSLTSLIQAAGPAITASINGKNQIKLAKIEADTQRHQINQQADVLRRQLEAQKAEREAARENTVIDPNSAEADPNAASLESIQSLLEQAQRDRNDLKTRLGLLERRPRTGNSDDATGQDDDDSPATCPASG